MLTSAMEFPLKEIVRWVLGASGRTSWRIREDDFWTHAETMSGAPRVQGWKLHLSATPLSAPLVLHQAAGVLVDGDCGFKFAGELSRVEQLTSTRYDRAQAGKFITAYPRDDDHLRALAQALHLATAGLPGPRILSDRAYLPDSLVHIRYGAFHGLPTLTNDGSYEARIAHPDGHPIPDRRTPWFSPPVWVTLPIPTTAPPTPVSAGRKKVLLHDRFAVSDAIRHSARGGVYRATDQVTGAEVIIKQARPHIGATMSGTDARTVLRVEAQRLEELAGLGPEPITLFEQDGHVFLAESTVPGRSLASWVQDEFARLGPDQGPSPEQAADVAGQLADLLGEVHRRGLVFRDLTSGNIMITPDRRLQLIDPELASRPDEWTYRAYTPGHVAPEVVAGASYGPTPGRGVDCYALGTVLFHLVTGLPPIFPADGPAPDGEPPRPTSDRIALILSLVAVRSAAARRLGPAILGLTADEPGERWTLDELHAFLADLPTGPSTRHCAGSGFRPAANDRLDDATCDRLISDGLDHIVATLDTGADRIWPSNAFGSATDSCNVQYGAAGVLAVLTRASEILDRPVLRDAVAAVAGWIDARRRHVPLLLPGLYFGRSGTAWALYDAARHLEDDVLAEHAAELAADIPVRWPNPDICHGAAGAGMAQLHLWQATGRPEFLDRAGDCADGLLTAARHVDDGVFWPVPADFDSELAGSWHYGFAHGVAGVGALLLAVGQATGREDCLAAARSAGDTLVTAADRDPAAGSARWRSDRGAGPAPKRSGAPGDLLYHWCSGSSGIGTFLLRLARQFTDDARYRCLTEEAAVAVRQTRWISPPAVCHGLAGNGEFLLDLARDLAEDDPASAQRHRGAAAELAAALYARHALRGGRMVLPDESQLAITVSYGTGLAGALGFLLRLRHGGPRWWMADGARP